MNLNVKSIIDYLSGYIKDCQDDPTALAGYLTNAIKDLENRLCEDLKDLVEEVLKEELSNSNNLAIDFEFNEDKTSFEVLIDRVDGADYPDYNGYDFEDNVDELNSELKTAIENRLEEDKRFAGIEITGVNLTFDMEFEEEKREEEEDEE